ncbi:MAG TPA: DUF1697 domain-containing protein [Sphingomicrobium sp.]|nr:DUF1697 domain-containing protein [Sphingomicrobium sp.]
MTSYVALLRGVNLMGSTTLRMSDLKAIAERLGLERPRTFIASGNLLFTSEKSELSIKTALETALKKHMARDVGVMVRTAGEIEQVVADNPFADQPGNRVVAIFLDSAPGKDSLDHAKGVADERMALGKREIYVHYPGGQGRSKLRIPAAVAGTARNMNSVAKIAALAKEAT